MTWRRVAQIDARTVRTELKLAVSRVWLTSTGQWADKKVCADRLQIDRTRISVSAARQNGRKSNKHHLVSPVADGRRVARKLCETGTGKIKVFARCRPTC